MRRHLLYLARTVLLLVTANTAVAASGDETACAALGPAFAGRHGLSLETAPALAHSVGLPAFCQLRGRAAGKVGFEMRLPLHSDWNGKFLLAGCGGFCGQLLPDKPGYSNSINEALKNGYAAMAHDSGHRAASTADTDWARSGDDRALALWAEKVLPTLVAVADEIIDAYYQRTPNRRYFSGCSNGGRLGLVAAQRYPDLFDGIAAGGPILDLSGNAGVQGAWMIQQAWTAAGAPRFSPEQVHRLAAHVRSACDTLDGVEDNLVAAPERCQPDLSALRCAADPDPGCMSEDQLQRVAALYRGAHDGETQLFPGLPPGSEHLWPFWITGLDGQPAWGGLASQGFLDIYRRVPAGEHVKPTDIDVVAEAAQMAASPVALLANATDPDLSGLRAAGSKLLLWHGWADPLILPQRTIRYFEAATATNGGAAALGQQARLFLVPGHGHCWEAPGLAPDLFDPVQILDAWVEQNVPPAQIVARNHLDPEAANATALLCPYPQRAIHDTRGPANQAASYRCRE
ncbi:MAG: tannase/feruloyl esterase family alpha/beta hydrolase [Haliea sp.]|uniref:tannase/feruloyl esterase family alpha/beta hydrolase n=1 Tax=Haliea sp. TaxID=1932666 RepID=UPI0032ECF40F